MASSKKAQSKAGIPAVRRGQQMGDERTVSPDKERESKANTPALRGRRKEVNEFFADDSAQQVSTEGDRPRSNTPSIPAALPTGEKLGESDGERVFKQRQPKSRK